MLWQTVDELSEARRVLWRQTETAKYSEISILSHGQVAGVEICQLLNEIRSRGIEIKAISIFHQARHSLGELHHHAFIEGALGKLNPRGNLRRVLEHEGGAVYYIGVRQAAACFR